MRILRERRGIGLSERLFGIQNADSTRTPRKGYSGGRLSGRRIQNPCPTRTPRNETQREVIREADSKSLPYANAEQGDPARGHPGSRIRTLRERRRRRRIRPAPSPALPVTPPPPRHPASVANPSKMGEVAEYYTPWMTGRDGLCFGAELMTYWTD